MPNDNRPQWVAYKKELYNERKRKHLCVSCGNPLPKDDSKRVNCPDCRLKQKNCRERAIDVRTDPLSGLDKDDPNQPTSADNVFGDSEEQITDRKRRQNQFRDNVVAAEKAGMSYGKYMAQKYLESIGQGIKRR